MPMTWGWRRPVVLLPAGAEAWPEPRRRAVLLHELAHVARRRLSAQLAAEVVRALYWFNPLVWMAARKLRIESEHACDDRVLAAGARRLDYAGDLLEIARSLRALRAAAPAGLTMARPSQLAGRLLAVLDAHRDRRGISRRLALPAWLIAICVVIPLAARRGRRSPLPPLRRQNRLYRPFHRLPLAPSAPAAPSLRSSGGPTASPRSVEPSRTSTAPRPSNGRTTVTRSGSGRKASSISTDDWTGIVRLARGAEIRIEEEVGRDQAAARHRAGERRPARLYLEGRRHRARPSTRRDPVAAVHAPASSSAAPATPPTSGSP